MKEDIDYRFLLENATEGIIVADSKTLKFLIANSAICNLRGYSEKEMLGF